MRETPTLAEQLADKRTTLARDRTFYAIERTLAAWIRTGFSIAGAGVTLATALRNTSSRELSLTMGTLMIIMGILTFIYALYEYFESYRFIQEVYSDPQDQIQNFRINLIAATVLTVALIIISIMGLLMIILRKFITYR